jgi:hypothetical protein
MSTTTAIRPTPIERATTSPIDELLDRAAARFRSARISATNDSADASDLLMRALRQSIEEAFESGRTTGIAEELGVLVVIYDESVPRFPWQVFCRDETCVLISPDATDHLVIASGIRDDDLPFTVSMIDVPSRVLEAVRRAVLPR